MCSRFPIRNSISSFKIENIYFSFTKQQKKRKMNKRFFFSRRSFFFSKDWRVSQIESKMMNWIKLGTNFSLIVDYALFFYIVGGVSQIVWKSNFLSNQFINKTSIFICVRLSPNQPNQTNRVLLQKKRNFLFFLLSKFFLGK